jgi:hypothetical protein
MFISCGKNLSDLTKISDLVFLKNETRIVVMFKYGFHKQKEGKVHSKRVGKINIYTRSEWRR